MSFYNSCDFPNYDYHYDHDKEHLKCCDGSKLVVYKRDNLEEDSPPEENNQWVGIKSGWTEPYHIKAAVRFHNGLVEIRSPGVYSYRIVNTTYSINESESPISGQTFLRVSKARRCRDNNYEVVRDLATDMFASIVPNVSIIEDRKRQAVLSLNVDVVIRQCDIDRGEHYLIPESKSFVHLLPGQSWPEGLRVGTGTSNSQNYINVTKIGDVY